MRPAPTLITTGGGADAHWQVVPNGSVVPQPLYVVAPGNTGWYGGWPANGPASSWVTMDPNSVANNTHGSYSTTFDLTGVSLDNLCLVGAMGVDDYGMLFVNGNPVTDNFVSVDHLTALNIALPASILNAGLNTLSLSWGWTDNSYEAFRLQGSIQNCGATATGFSLVGASPAPGTTGVATNTDVVLSFNNKINPATVNSNTIQVWAGWDSNRKIAGEYTVTGETVVFRPTGFFPSNSAIYLVTCNNSLSDMAAAGMCSTPSPPAPRPPAARPRWRPSRWPT